jgi:predicted nucleotidyltransferase
MGERLVGETIKLLSRYNITVDMLEGWVRQHYNAKPLFMCVTGSHMWGTSDKDSDLDIRGVFINRTYDVLSLYPPRDTIETINAFPNVDIQMYELGKTFKMLLGNNGNIVEMLLTPTVFLDTSEVDFTAVADGFLTQELATYYAGYYHSQRKRAAQNRGGKALLYAYRELMAGIILMKYKSIVYDFPTLIKVFEEGYGPMGLLRWYQLPEHRYEPQNDEALATFEQDWQRLLDILNYETKVSKLANTPDAMNLQYLNGVLLDVRRANW